MGDEATGKESSTVTKKVEKATERRRYDLTGSIPQWITSALLAVIGVLILMVWNSMDRRVTDMEKRIEVVMSAHDAKFAINVADIATLKAHTEATTQTVAELRAGQAQTGTMITQVVTELKFLSAQLSRPK